jgi:type I restriction enzyme M protein
MLIWSAKYVREHGENQDNLTLQGQERNYGNYGMCKMNMILQGIAGFRIEHQNVITDPLLVEDGKLLTYDKVVANFPFSMNWDSSRGAKDPYGRFKFGVPPAKGKADFAFIQHIYSILNENGMAAVICSQGVLFRENVEKTIREGMVREDVIEGIVALPSNLFYGTGIPACILILNKNKDTRRKNKIVFIYAAKDFEELPKRDKLRSKDIEKIVSAFKEYKEIDRYCHIAGLGELQENKFNLNVPRYVDISEPEEEVDIQVTIDELRKLENEKQELATQVNMSITELGFRV